LAACNPKGTYDSSQPLTVNIAISSPLLSRFDIVLLLMDSANEDWDRLASTFLLEGKDLLVKEKIKPWKFEQLRLYINYVKKFQPELTQEANLVIQRYYQLQRQADDRNAARTTVRMLESIIRLSQAHAKLMFRNEVLVMDAVVAITLMECSLNKSASFGNVNILHTSFPDNAEIEYLNQGKA
jgi:DNA helicase MCM9